MCGSKSFSSNAAADLGALEPLAEELDALLSLNALAIFPLSVPDLMPDVGVYSCIRTMSVITQGDK